METLTAEKFTIAALPELQDFYCGDEEWDVQVASWIGGQTAEPKVTTLLETRNLEVWLYRNAHSLIVGYGALLPERWTVGNDKIKVTSLVSFGVQKQFHGQPPGESTSRFSHLIFSDLGARALALGRPYFALLVHKKNERAKSFYRRFGFTVISEVRHTYERMYLDLRAQLERHSSE